MATEAVGIAQASKPAAASRAAGGLALESATQSWRVGLSRPIYARQASASLAESGAEAPRGLKSALQDRRGVRRMRNSREVGAPGQSVVRGVLQKSEWKSKAQRVLEKNVRTKKMVALQGLHARVRILTGRIEALEDELDLLGWKPRVYRCPTYKPPYPDRVIEELCALPEKARAQRVQEMADQEGIDRKSVYRKLQKSLRWTLRRREDPALESKSDALLSRRAAVSDVR
jgi:hypothetical protein